MDLFTSLLDILFLLLALSFFPRNLLPINIRGGTGETHSVPPTPLSAHSFHSARLGGNGIDSPLTSPLFSPHPPNGSSAFQGIPQITLTPDRPSDNPSPKGHKRKTKSVSFSLSSMNEILHPNKTGDDEDGKGAGGKKKRPPTPFIRGPASPSQRKAGGDSGDDRSAPPTPMDHSIENVDPMGVQKKWLMA